MSDEVRPANPKACADCPWRLSNHGGRHQHGFFTKRNLARLWAGLRRGERMSCHPTDSRMAEFEGYEQTGEREVTHECTGALIVVQREFMRYQEILEQHPEADAREVMRLYREQRPGGLTRDGLVQVLERAMFGGTALGGIVMARPNLNDCEVGYEPLGTWKPR